MTPSERHELVEQTRQAIIEAIGEYRAITGTAPELFIEVVRGLDLSRLWEPLGDSNSHLAATAPELYSELEVLDPTNPALRRARGEPPLEPHEERPCACCERMFTEDEMYNERECIGCNTLWEPPGEG